MKADLGRVTADPGKRFLRVLQQQGRVQLESDWNEQIDIILRAVRELAVDLIGPWGGSPGAFRLQPMGERVGDVSIAPGRYYVGGICCVHDGEPPASYRDQPFLPATDVPRLEAERGGRVGHYLAYLDVWERLVTAAEDQDIREVALGGPDTAARSQVVWQVKTTRVAEDDLSPLTCDRMLEGWSELQRHLEAPQRGRLRARARMPEADIERPCAVDPTAAYRHDENALFRVEVHRPGPAGEATFKWSADNGSVAFPVESFAGEQVQVTTLGRDVRRSLQAGDMVEVEHDAYVLGNRAEPLLRVESVDLTELTVTLERSPTPVGAEQHPRLRRWDQQGSSRHPLEDDGSIGILEAEDPDGPWIELGYGVQVQFLSAAEQEPPIAHHYRTGDHWLIPARTAVGDVLWPQDEGTDGQWTPADLPPDGVEHHYAPLAWLKVASDGTVEVERRFQRTINPMATCPEDP